MNAQTIKEEDDVAEEENWRTKDMAMVAYLSLRGFVHESLERDGRSVYWVFSDTEQLHDEVDIFLQGDGRVEPGAFNDAFASIKRDMFRFLDGHS